MNLLTINLALSINFNLQDVVFVTSSPFLPILQNPFSIGSEKLMYFSVFSSIQVNYPSNSSASSFIMN